MANSSEIPDEFMPIEKPSLFGALLGPIYERVDEDGSFTRDLQVKDKHTYLGGVVHGGVLMAFVDVIMGTISYRHARRTGASIRIVSDFIAPARIGDWLEGRGEVVKATKSVVFARGHLNVEGRTILPASGNYKLQGRPHSGD